MSDGDKYFEEKAVYGEREIEAAILDRLIDQELVPCMLLKDVGSWLDYYTRVTITWPC